MTTIDDMKRRDADLAEIRAKAEATEAGRLEAMSPKAEIAALLREMEAISPPAQAQQPNTAPKLSRRDMMQNLEASTVIEAITDEDAAAICSDTLADTHAMRVVRRWHEAREADPKAIARILALVGLTGRGKTVAGAWLIARLGGRYITFEEFRRLSQSRDARDREEMEKVIRTRVVMMDDAGTEEPQGSPGAMYTFVNRRAGRSVCWSLLPANLTAQEFGDRFGLRTVRRIQHCGMIVTVTGEDLRRGGR